MRHYQVTDDGQALPPILMFHPDYDWVDADGQADRGAGGSRRAARARAAEGMPIEMLEPPAAAGGPGPELRRVRSRARSCSRSPPSLASALLLGVYARVVRPTPLLGFVALVPWLAALDRARTLRGALAVGARAVRRLRARGVRLVRRRASPPTPARRARSRSALLVLLAPLLQPQLLVFALARAAGRARARARCADRSPRRSRGSAPSGRCRSSSATALGHGLHASRVAAPGAPISRAPAGSRSRCCSSNECRARGAPRPRAARARARARSRSRPSRSRALRRGPPARARGRASRGDAARDRRARAGRRRATTARSRDALGTFDAVRAILDTHFALSHERARARRRVELLRLAGDGLPDDVRRAEERGRRRLRPRDRARSSRSTRRAARVRRVRRGGRRRVQRRRASSSPRRDGRAAFETYRKATLFPLTERVPAWLDSPALRARLPWLGSWRAGAGARGRAAAARRRTRAPRRAADLLRRARARARARGRARGRGAPGHALERLLVRRRRRPAPPPRRVGVPQHRDAPPAAPRHNDRDLRRDRRERRDRRRRTRSARARR